MSNHARERPYDMSFKLRVYKLNPKASLPVYATQGAAGMDVHACLNEDMIVAPLSTAIVPTGLAVDLPHGYEVQVRPRSGLAFKNGITVLNSPGTIDSDYRGEIKVCLINLGKESFTITDQMRIAQLVVSPVLQATVELVDTISSTERGSGGFGSTGL